ncbi:MAG: Succinate dehydrogenase/Fumarate reductase transmembrane subunit [Syntrophaceae bacterium PtaU1.Bin231]|nr:MAG: Succinate dehydrogenase/Fumarate reductase transmembrane subunit [Syntrophaceae bacterium PtaU1.Bin231]
MADNKYDNHLGITGWFGGGRWGLERYVYILHRITGLGILIFFIVHIYESSLRRYGPEEWEAAMEILRNPFFKFGEFLVFAGFAFHALNGIRLVLIEFGWAVGKAIEPVYPYKSSLNTQRPLMIIIMILSAVFILAGGYNILFLG